MIQEEQKNISAIILSAGKSERMGVPKFSLKFDSKTTFLEKLIGEYHSYGCYEIIVVINPKSAELLNQLQLIIPNNVKIVINDHPEWERFYSLKLGALNMSEIMPVFVSNIDNPFVSQSILQSLAQKISNFDYVSPSIKGKGGHPIMISGSIINDLRNETQDQIHLKEYLSKYKKTKVEVDDHGVLININTIDDYNSLFNVV